MTMQEFSWIDSIGNLNSAMVNSSSPAIFQSTVKKKVQEHEIWLEKKYGTKRYHELQEEFISSWDLDRALKGVNKAKTLMKMKQKFFSILVPIALAGRVLKVEKDKKESDPLKKAQEINKYQEDILEQLEKERKNVGKGKIFGIWKDREEFDRNERLTYYRLKQLEKYKNWLINGKKK